jgi:tetratricopeptide (TPR) repeat protein
LDAQRLGSLEGEAHEKAAASALARLDAAADRFGATCELQHLWTVVEAQRFLHGGDPQRGAAAKSHARLALDLCADMPRFLASTRTALATVEAALGNFGEVVTALSARALLPHTEKGEELAACLLRARAQYHLGEDEGSAASVGACAKLASEDPSLAIYKDLVAQRRGLYALGAGRFEEAAEAFGALAKGAPSDDAAQRLSVALGLAASELGRGHAKEALAAVASARPLVDAGARAPVGPHGRPVVRGTLAQAETWRRDVTILLDGLAGEAHALAGEHAKAEPLVVARLASLEARFKVTGLDEDLEAMAMGEARLGDVVLALGRRAEALDRYDRSLRALDDWGRRTGTPYGDAAIDVLLRYGAMAVGEAPPVRREAHARLERAFTVLARTRDPKRARVRDELATYLALLGEAARPVAK